MCLAIPALIKKIEASSGDVDMGGIETRVSLLLTPEVKVGEYVIVHAGFSIAVVNNEEAEETLDLLRGILDEE